MHIVEKFRSARFVIATVLSMFALVLWGLRIFVIAPVTAVTGFLLFCLAATLPLSVYAPVLAAACNVALFTFTAATDQDPNLLALTSLVTIAVITAQNHIKTALILSAAVIIVGFYDPQAEAISFDTPSLMVFGLLTATAFGTGWWTNTTLKREKERQRVIRRRQQELAGLLHDTVAADLTSLIVRLEALAITNPDQAPQIKQCADTARKSMRDTRQLLHELGAPVGRPSNETTPALATTLTNTSEKLKEHGFTVELSNELTSVPSAESFNKAMSQALSEAATNIIKYGSTRQPVILSAVSTPLNVSVTISNGYRSGHSRGNSSKLGLGSMERTIAAVGGRMRLNRSDSQWSLTFTAPISKV